MIGSGISSATQLLLEGTLLSSLLVVPFWWVLRASSIVRAAIVACMAVPIAFLEGETQQLAGPVWGVLVLLVLVAPAVEEIVKLAVAGPWGGTPATAASVGLGFAAIENGLYFAVAAGGQLVPLLLLVGVRAFTDPVLHVTATTLSVRSARGQPWGLPSGILLHGAWNALVFYQATAASLSLPAELLELAAATSLIGILLVRLQRPERVPRPGPALAGPRLTPGGTE